MWRELHGAGIIGPLGQKVCEQFHFVVGRAGKGGFQGKFTFKLLSEESKLTTRGGGKVRQTASQAKGAVGGKSHRNA